MFSCQYFASYLAAPVNLICSVSSFFVGWPLLSLPKHSSFQQTATTERWNAYPLVHKFHFFLNANVSNCYILQEDFSKKFASWLCSFLAWWVFSVVRIGMSLAGHSSASPEAHPYLLSHTVSNIQVHFFLLDPHCHCRLYAPPPILIHCLFAVPDPSIEKLINLDREIN